MACMCKPYPSRERAGTEPVLEEEKRPARTHREEEARLARRAQKLDRYEQVLARA